MTPTSEHGTSPSRFHSAPNLLAGALLAALLLALFAAYASHFHNAFHFDDFHTITQNPAIRSLDNVPRFFTDARTFSVLPTHYSYRPLVTASLAFDYWLGKGLDPLWFHISTFVWYGIQLGLMYLLFIRIMNRSSAEHQNVYAAVFAVAWYALHPVNAETVNYIIQRGDLYSTLGVVAGLAVYCYWPRGRKWGIYLLPAALGGLAKPSALVFPALLFVYSLLFEDQGHETARSPLSWFELRRAAIVCLPAMVVCVALAVFETCMTPKTFVAGAASRVQYWLTQPLVALHYVKSFFLPTELTADTDRPLVANVFSEGSVIGIAFLCVLFGVAWSALRSRETRPVAFGLFWFLIALLPTSLIPLAEPDNDHRMFFPFVGLTLAMTWAVRLFLAKQKERWANNRGLRAAILGSGFCLLGALAYGTHLRNGVWRSEESLWLDVTQKSPRNGRGLMNYGLSQMTKGNMVAAYDYFQRATAFTPNYSTLEINLGVAAGAMRRDAEAEEHFRRAIALAPQDSQSYSFFGHWLQGRARITEAISMLNRSAELNPADLDPRYALMPIYLQQSDWADLKRVTDEVLRVAPEDADARRYSFLAQTALAQTAPARVAPSGQQAPSLLSAENYLNLSLVHFQAGRYEDCVHAAKEALRLRPNYAEAYNNLAAAYQSMGRWDEAIEAAQEALRLKPDLQLARNNLAYASTQKALRAKQILAKAEGH
jgi:tetratricopeptide (TPR) repeat protein